MPLYAAKRYLVEAFRYAGNTLNLPDDINAVIINYQAGGRALIRTADGQATLFVGDWLVRDGSGTIYPVRAAAFEVMFEPESPDEPMQFERRRTRHVRHESAAD